MKPLIPTLSLQVTYQCNAECKHCGPYCGPHETDWMSMPEIKDLILQAAELGAYNVVFTGGEPTLLGNKLVELLMFIRDETSIASTRMVTNGKWATTYERAYKKLSDWQNAGLVELNISCGEFHQEFIPLERVVNAYRAAKDLSYQTVLLNGLFRKGSKFNAAEFKKIIREATGEEPLPPELMSPFVSKCHGMMTGTAMNYGRGAQYIGRDDMDLMEEEEIQSRCSQVLSGITAHPNGNLTACCGIMVRDKSLLHIGNWREEKLETILMRADQDLVLNWIRYLGLRDMKRWLLEKDPDIEFRDKYSGICDLCSDIFFRKRCEELLLEHGGEREGDVIINKIAHDSTITNSDFQYADIQSFRKVES